MKEKDAKKQQSKLEKEYDQINIPNKTLEEIEKVSVSVHIVPIQDYQMKEGDYKIIITVYEGQELEPHDAKLFNLFDLKKSAVDAFVEIQIMGQTRKTAVLSKLHRLAKRPTILFGKSHFILPFKI